MLDAHRLALLAEVAHAGSIAGAAQRLSFTPSAVSPQLGKLERDVGAPLLPRNPRGVPLTPAGEALLGPAETIVGPLRTAARPARADPDAAAGGAVPADPARGTPESPRPPAHAGRPSRRRLDLRQPGRAQPRVPGAARRRRRSHARRGLRNPGLPGDPGAGRGRAGGRVRAGERAGPDGAGADRGPRRRRRPAAARRLPGAPPAAGRAGDRDGRAAEPSPVAGSAGGPSPALEPRGGVPEHVQARAHRAVILFARPADRVDGPGQRRARGQDADALGLALVAGNAGGST